jgi:formylglycine-generating enzyme required for sulfatase activity
MADVAQFKYRAFLSYSHADATVAKRIHARLEGYRIDKDLVGQATPTGPIPQTLRPIFRDRSDFDAGGPLAASTTAALDDSAALILIASPDSARSKYVNEEVQLFKSRYPDRPLIPLIVGGKPGDPNQEPFPSALRFAVGNDGTMTDVPADIIAADLRDEGDGFELALAKVVARLIGLTPDLVYRRAEKAERATIRLKRRRQILLASLAATIVAILGLSQIGLLNREQIENLYNLSRNQTRNSTLTTGQTVTECLRNCPEMVVVPPGQFWMGKRKGQPTDAELAKPKLISIGRSLLISKFEITFAQWDACVNDGGCVYRPDDQGFGRANMPVMNVSWLDVQEYIAWLRQKTGMAYRLLSEAEWEYAARGITSATEPHTAYPWGDSIGVGHANCIDCGGKWNGKGPAPVGSFQPNRFGLFDMNGNVWEWVEDPFNNDLNDGRPTDGSPYVLPDPDKRKIKAEGGDVIMHTERGGSWTNHPGGISATWRFWARPGNRAVDLGFRVGRTL